MSTGAVYRACFVTGGRVRNGVNFTAGEMLFVAPPAGEREN